MERQEYREILGRLPIESPTPEDMAMVCPHLTQEQAVKAFTEGDSNYVACSPLRVRSAFQIVSLRKPWTEEIKVWRGDTQVITGTKEHPARLDWSYTGRTRASYADGQSHGSVFRDYAHIAEAIKFAEDNWDDELILDDWASAVTFYIQDPSELVNSKYLHDAPKTKAVLYVTLNRDLNETINDHSRPESELFDEAIVEMTADLAVWHELKGGRGGFTNFNCAYCGSGLGLSGCNGCGYKFRDDHSRCGWDTPLSRKMVEFLQENGLTFKKDPEIAWEQEQVNYERRKQEAEEWARQRAEAQA